ncbi:hypothetical protein GJ744_003080 [Endocarpon pusillum]|uniref:Uncharacterized protein n=1 Tax=Endocarpon pusillum TaxID=364733 RepID=A0A8H7API3_9EURO|nr:hypothetical protein GJ744_003080 [Endocarpon pusillum]
MTDNESSNDIGSDGSMGARVPNTSHSAAASQRLDQLSSHLRPNRVAEKCPTGARDTPSVPPDRRIRKPRSQIEALPPE